MARNGVRIRLFSSVAPSRRGSRALMVLAVWGLGSIAPAACEGSGIARYLTPRDRSDHIVLSETGQPITGRLLAHPGAALSQGILPAYAAFPLSGGERLPAGVPTVTAGPQAGETTVGPLDLTPMVQANLNASLNAAGMAIVQTPTQSYAVEYLPRYGRIEAHERSSTASSADPSAGTSSTSTSASDPSSLSALESNLTIEGIPAKDIAHWVDSGSSGILNWTSTELAELEKALKISPKPTATKPSLNLEAQMLMPPLANSSGTPLPVPAPEPSTWLVFGLILGAAGLRQWAGKLGRGRHFSNGVGTSSSW